MDSSPRKQPFKAQVFQILIFSGLLTVWTADQNPHTPDNHIWRLKDDYGTVITRVSEVVPLGTWFPELSFDLLKVIPSGWWLRVGKVLYYVCPSTYDGPPWRKHKCGHLSGGYFCASWGCETQGPWLHQPRPEALVAF